CAGDPATKTTDPRVDSDADADADADSDSDADVDADSDTDADADSDADTDPDAAPVVGDLVVTEIMADPLAVDGDFGEYVELTSTATHGLDLAGLELADDDGTGFSVVGTWILAPGERAVFAPSADPLVNGGLTVDYTYDVGELKLGNEGDTVTISIGGDLLDAVVYDPVDAGWPVVEGASSSLDPDSTDPEDNDDPDSWCSATAPYGDGDHGSPGDPNEEC
ncbi:MAG: lamin tail domain-containing protein, partial [Myxococcota bacterium]